MGACTFQQGVLGFGGNFLDGEGPYDVHRQYRVVRGLLSLSASYATGGDTLAPAIVNLKEVKRMLVDPALGLHSAGITIALDATNPAAPKVLAYETNDTEVANTTNLSARRPIGVWFLGVG